MNSKLFGGILLVVGTTIGAGMLALPVATAQLGFWGSFLLLIGCWLIMTASAFLFLEVNLWLPPNSNLVSMAGATLGRSGQAITWVVYLVLLYSIICAYIAGGGDLFHYVLATNGIHLPQAVASILFTTIFGSIVYMGIRSVDYVNRGLMMGKMGALLLLICLIMPFISSANLDAGEFKNIIAPSSLTVTAVSFGCLMIIPLLCYIAWDMVIMGVVPLDGIPGLKAMTNSTNTNSDLVTALNTILHKDSVTFIAKFFTSICMATSFLGVSLSLSDFLSDGSRVKKQGLMGNLIILGATFVPPVVIVLFYPNAFLLGLEFAGISILILMVLFPPMMTWSGRYRKAFASTEYLTPANKPMLIFLMLLGAILLGISGTWGMISLVSMIGIFTIKYIAGKVTAKTGVENAA